MNPVGPLASSVNAKVPLVIKKRLFDCQSDEVKGMASMENVSPQEVADRVAAAARAGVPEQVQMEMQHEIKRFLDANI